MSWFENQEMRGRVRSEELALVDAAELVSCALERRNTSRSALAKAVGVSISEISQRMSGERNVTLRSLASMLDALDFDLVLDCRDRRDGERISEVPNAGIADWEAYLREHGRRASRDRTSEEAPSRRVTWSSPPAAPHAPTPSQPRVEA